MCLTTSQGSFTIPIGAVIMCPLTYTDRIVELGGTPSVGSKGDSYDNALAESQFALFKTELIKKGAPGGPLNRSSWQRWSGCGGSIISVCIQGLTTAPQRKSKQRITLNETPC